LRLYLQQSVGLLQEARDCAWLSLAKHHLDASAHLFL
jgi:hypothetical protein